MSSPAERIIFIVVDPAQDEPLALQRALSMSRAPVDEDVIAPKIHVLLAVDYNNTDTSADNPAVHRDRAWMFDKLINPLEASGLEYTLDLSWSSDWYGSIISVASKIKPEMIMVPLVNRPSNQERIFNESIWRLLRTAECPILLVQPGSAEKRAIILAAVNIQSHKPEYQRLNELIIERCKWVATNYSADLQVVNAYKDSLNYPDRTQLAQMSEVDTAKIHVKAGDPDAVIADTAKQIGADLVVIGLAKRSSRWRGHTSGKIITRISCDILVLN